MAEIEETNEMLDDLLDEDTQKDRFLSFRIDKEDYAIEIKHVIEIIGIQRITKVPNIKDFIKGIINLRGNIIPVVDVRTRFKLQPIPYNDRTCIVVVKLINTAIGLIVDEVQEVVNMPEDKIAPPPQTNKGTHSRFISGIGKVGKIVKIILNINRLLYDDDQVLTLEENIV